jgi:hypothetical protein
VLFSCFVFLAIVVSVIVKIIILARESTFDNHHQFIVEIKEDKQQEKIIAFNPNTNTMAVLDVSGVKNSSDIRALQIPIDAQLTLPEKAHFSNITSLLFSMQFHCQNQGCVHSNSVDLFKLYLFAKSLHGNAIKTDKISLPASQATLSTRIPALFTDTTIYKEAISIAIVNASGQPGLGTLFSDVLTNIGCNVIAVSTGDVQDDSSIQSTEKNPSNTLYRVMQVFHTKSQQMQKPGISDIIITIGKNHPQL